MRTGKLGKPKFGFQRTAVSNFKSKRHEGSTNELVNYSRAPCLGSGRKARGLRERDRIAFAESCRFLTIQSLEFQEIWQK